MSLPPSVTMESSEATAISSSDPQSLPWREMIGATLLVAGTSIGAGMLGLPLKTAQAGFSATLVFFFLVWAMMCFTGLVTLEVSLWLKGETNLISMAKMTLGRRSSHLLWLVYVLFLYSVMSAYTAGGASMVSATIQHFFDNALTVPIATLYFVLPFLAVIYLGVNCADKVNRWLMFGLVASYTAILTLSNDGDYNPLTTMNDVSYVVGALSLAVTSFGFHSVIPSLKNYLGDNARSLRLTIILGSSLPLIFYIIWEYVILSIIPVTGTNSIESMLAQNENHVKLLADYLSQSQPKILLAFSAFSFFALTSSFVGVALGLFDFFADAFQISKSRLNKGFLLGVTFLPPTLFTLLYPQGFLLALGYAGAFASILLIIYPCLMAWAGRYWYPQITLASRYRVAGGKLSLLIPLIVGTFVVVYEFYSHLH